MAYKLMKRIIERGGYDIDDVMEKLDTFYAAGRMTKEEYEELMGKIHTVPENNGEGE